MDSCGRKPNLGKLSSMAICSCVALGLVMGFTYRATPDLAMNSEVDRFRREIETFSTIAQLEDAKTVATEKIISIISRFNRKMSPELKAQIGDEIYRMSLKYSNLDIDLICATISHESALTWEPTVVSPAGAMGLMQIMPSTGMSLAEIEGIPWTTPEDVLFKPLTNIRLGCRYLSYLIEAYEVDGGLAAYNGGERRAQLWINSGRADGVLYDETQGYIPAVLGLYEKFHD